VVPSSGAMLEFAESHRMKSPWRAFFRSTGHLWCGEAKMVGSGLDSSKAQKALLKGHGWWPPSSWAPMIPMSRVTSRPSYASSDRLCATSATLESSGRCFRRSSGGIRVMRIGRNEGLDISEQACEAIRYFVHLWADPDPPCLAFLAPGFRPWFFFAAKPWLAIAVAA